MSALTSFAYPGKHINLNAVADQIYTKYVGPDTTADTNGMTKSQATSWFNSNPFGHIGYYYLQAVVDRCRASNDFEELRHHMAAMNKCNIPVMLGIDDESHLKTPDGKKLHSWNDVGLGHAIIRLGMDMEQPITLILDPAAPCPPFPFPTPINWTDLVACNINTALGVMPPGISAPPADFEFYANGHEMKWPVPPPAVDLNRAATAIQGMEVAIAALKNMADALDSGHLHTVVSSLQAGCQSVLVDIGKA